MDSTLLLLFLSAFPFCSAIECYFCTTASDHRCHNVYQFQSQKTSMQPMECEAHMVDTTLSNIRKDIASPDGYDYSCIKIETRPAYTNKTEVIRGCIQTAKGGYDPCNFVRKHLIDQNGMSYCSDCKTYACNAGSSLHSHFAVVTATSLLFSWNFF